eukprot:3163978-Pyramimonas_sp.AAC.1
MAATELTVLPVPGGPCTTVTWCRAVAARALAASSLRLWRLAPSSKTLSAGNSLVRWKTRPIASSTSWSEKGVARQAPSREGGAAALLSAPVGAVPGVRSPMVALARKSRSCPQRLVISTLLARVFSSFSTVR